MILKFYLGKRVLSFLRILCIKELILILLPYMIINTYYIFNREKEVEIK